MIFIYVFIGSGSNLDRFDDYIETLGARMFRCSLCGKVSSAKSNLKTFLEGSDEERLKILAETLQLTKRK